ncbi:MAG: cystathionine gamma-synthase [Kangiella sp.]|nr:cystathionine gamma-synthase [Kangiella sp.]
MTSSNQTIAVRSGIESDQQFGAVTPPLYLSSNYTFADLEQPRRYDYSRSGNPTRDTLADTLAELEAGCGGVITSSGMSAIYLVTHLCGKDDVIIAPHDCYGGTYRLLNSLAEKGQFKVVFVDQGCEESLQQALQAKPKLIWIETPSNPLLRVVDIQNICKLAGQDIIKVVDNTFLSPVLQQPLTLGADIVVHSTTKYINGHSDVVGGAVIAKEQESFEQLSWWANCIGVTGSPFDSFITSRGLRTLSVRIRQHQENTQKVVEYLQQQPLVKNIYYPGLNSHPTHHIAKSQQQGFGAMLSFELHTEQTNLRTFVNTLKLFSLAESLGGVESLICHPATMTHAAMDPAARLKAGISNSLLRLSVGIEEADDLVRDLDSAFQRCQIKVLQGEQHG